MSHTRVTEIESGHHIVGIGASAGGLEALSQFVAGLTPGLECIYVVAQHMSPSHRSMMAEILSRETRIPVQELVDKEIPKPGIVYITPPGTNLVFKDGLFHLTSPSPEIAPKPSINLLFDSMAEEFGERAVGIILSGTGSDGTRGLRAIKSAGGITFVQIPETAKYDGMPRSAIDALVADRIVAPDQMGRELERVIRFPGVIPEFGSWDQRPAELADLFERVRLRTKIDFSSYKLSTVQRRLQRRLISTETGTLADYLVFTAEHPEELDALAKETLISVTEFFRDKDAFKTLERYAGEIVAQKKTGEEVRVWVVACATGEEAYSLAIMFLELIGRSVEKPRLHIFATDIDNDALAVARRGIYNQAAMAEVPSEYLSRYFQPSGNGFEPIKSLRDCVTFARQNVSVDPPFLRLDLVTCRNVLIYFNADLQSKVFSVLHYSLRENGLLFLGRSETVSQQEALFSAVDRRARIFRPRGQGRPVTMNKLVRGQLPSVPTTHRFNEKAYERLFFSSVADRFPPAMLIDGGFRILHSHGAVSRFINFPSGAPEMNLAQLIVPELSGELLKTLHQARHSRKCAYSRKRRIASFNNQTWRLAIHPLGEHWDAEAFLVAFESSLAPETSTTGEEEVYGRAAAEAATDDELAYTREHLQTLMEEMAASNEEMQALNEEVQAANEELQATNEELEASNEELQATNEELVSVNEESLAKTAELAAINSDFESVYNTIDFPILVFDTDLCLRRANGAAIRSYDLPQSHGYINIGRLSLPEYLEQIEIRLAKALSQQRKENFTAEFDGRTYQIFVNPTLNALGIAQSVVLVVVDNTDLVVAQKHIRESQERLLSIMNHSVSLISLKDASGRYEFINHRFEEMFAVTAAEAIGKTDHQLFNQKVAKQMRARDLEAMGQLSEIESTDELELNGKKIWLKAVRYPIFDSDGTAVRAICTQASDVTQKRHAEEQLRLAAKVFNSAGEAIVITDAAGNFITVNESFEQITGHSLSEVVGKNLNILKSDKHSQDFYDPMWRGLKEHGSWQGEIYHQRKNGEIYPEWLTINAVKDEGGEVVNYVSIFSDISAMKSSQHRIEFMATHDELTGIPNRSLLMDRLKHGISQAKRQKKKLAVLFIDLDNFKTINDNLGHEVGDLLLKQATERLQRCVRDSDTLARLGGDEFVVILMDAQVAQVNAIASRIVDFLSASFHINDQNLFVTASIGISMFPDDGEDTITLLKSADTAMYRVKEHGRNHYQFFTHEMKVLALQRMTLETGLRVAIDDGHFRMCYQPKIDITSGAICGAEALLRWRDPNIGEISPAHFIPIAEASGLMVAIGEIVFNMVLRQIAVWKSEGMAVPRIAINVSPIQLRDSSFVDKVKQWLDDAGVSAENVSIEITESALMDRIDVVKEMLEQLEQMGFSISIDDFGTGYSSLSYLKKLPIHELKVDRSFVDGIADEMDDRSITTAIINMAHALGLIVVAEGVETVEQLAVLKNQRCEVAQGYLFHHSLSEEDFSKALADSLRKTADANESDRKKK